MIMKKYLTLFVVMILLMPLAVFPDSTQNKYERKSISSIRSIILYGSAVNLTKTQRAVALKGLKSKIEMARFDYNVLPDSLTNEFTAEFDKIKNEEGVSSDSISAILRQTLLPGIVKILDAAKELRAKQNLSEADKNRFIALKAKESGLTAADLAKIFNSAYIYIPYFHTYTIKTISVKNIITGQNVPYYSVYLEGGIMWYKIVYKNQKFSVKLLKNIRSFGTGKARVGSKNSVDSETLSDKDYACYEAAGSFGDLAAKRTKEMEDFKLYAPVMEYIGGKVGVRLGRKEGIKLDERYYVKESALDKEGKLSRVERGYFRFSKIADNKKNANAMSHGSIIRGTADAGMLTEEKPLLGMIVQISGGLMMFSQKASEINIGSLVWVAQQKQMVIYPQADVRVLYDMAPLVKSTLFFTEVGVTGTFRIAKRDVKGWAYEEKAQKMNTIVYIPYIGIHKKFQWRAIAFGLGAGGEARFVKNYGTDPDDSSKTFSLEQKSFSAYAKAELTFSLNITSDFYIGLTARGPNIITFYKAKYDGDEVTTSGELPYDFTGAMLNAGFNLYF